MGTGQERAITITKHKLYHRRELECGGYALLQGGHHWAQILPIHSTASEYRQEMNTSRKWIHTGNEHGQEVITHRKWINKSMSLPKPHNLKSQMHTYSSICSLHYEFHQRSLLYSANFKATWTCSTKKYLTFLQLGVWFPHAWRSVHPPLRYAR